MIVLLLSEFTDFHNQWICNSGPTGQNFSCGIFELFRIEAYSTKPGSKEFEGGDCATPKIGACRNFARLGLLASENGCCSNKITARDPRPYGESL